MHHYLKVNISRADFASEKVFPLSSTQVGDRVVIQQIQTENMKNFLCKLGLTLASEVQVISQMTSGSIVVSLQGLGAKMANQVMVNLAAERS